PEQVQWATRAAQRQGIQVGMFLMWGYEGETIDDIEATVDHVKKANPDVFLTTVAYPIKNTPYYDSVADRVRLDKDWADATDRDFEIAGRPSRDYYRLADRSLPAEVEAPRLESSEPAKASIRRAAGREARAALMAGGET